MRFIFVTGGVASSLGKGLAAASLGALLQARGFRVCLRKLDPYLNVDPGTMSPYQHGEVFVTDDGNETDLDLGHYERFTGVSGTSHDYTTTGQIYSQVLAKERRGDYLGACVQVIPHITDAIKEFITAHTDPYDFIICEIGGTVGDIEGLPYLEAIRQLRNDLGAKHVMFLHLTLLPYIATSQEIKTKPTQHSVKELLSMGIQADILLCRTHYPMSLEIKKKLALFCNVPAERVITALDASSIYKVPLQYHQEGLDEQVCHYFGIETDVINIKPWEEFTDCLNAPQKIVKIAIVGKYIQLLDAYKSLIEALTHGAVANHVSVECLWIDAHDADSIHKLKDADGIIVPGGFGERGIQGKLLAIQYAREHNIPFLGICLGMQLAVIEACRNQLKWSQANSTEFQTETPHPVVCLMTEWSSDQGLIKRYSHSDKGGTMRLGAYPCLLEKDSKVFHIYGTQSISERHRHRFEVNPSYLKDLEKVGIRVVGKSPDGQLPEIIERPDHPWFIAVQFHPELKSRPFEAHPLFKSFVKACSTIKTF